MQHEGDPYSTPADAWLPTQQSSEHDPWVVLHYDGYSMQRAASGCNTNRLSTVEAQQPVVGITPIIEGIWGLTPRVSGRLDARV